MTAQEGWMVAFTALTAIASTIAAIAAISAARIANGQLRSMANALRVTGLVAVIDIEHKLNERKRAMDSAAADLVREDQKQRPAAAEIDKLKALHEIKMEEYLNCLDRLCHCFIHEYVPSGDWRLEYREYISEAVQTYPNHFRAGTKFKHIVRLNDRWQAL